MQKQRSTVVLRNLDYAGRVLGGDLEDTWRPARQAGLTGNTDKADRTGRQGQHSGQTGSPTKSAEAKKCRRFFKKLPIDKECISKEAHWS